MKSLLSLGAALLGLSSFADAAAISAERFDHLVPREVLAPRQAANCQGVANGPNSRNCWSNGFNSSTDMYQSWPNTGRIVDYTLTIRNTTCNPDGNTTRVCLLINDRFPGPTLFANWGDKLRIRVNNQMQHNGTSIHWHGIRQLHTTTEDGANGVTECAVAPGDSKVYEFQATEYGTSWYHSHFSHQYGDGVVGTIQINGPATADYDEDLGVLPMTDWTYRTAFHEANVAFHASNPGPNQTATGPPVPNNILVNGTARSANDRGAYANIKVTRNKRYRLRLINTSIDTNFVVNLDGHPFQVIATDFQPVVPFVTNYIQLGIGQRTDVIISTNATAGNYWLRVEADGRCSSRIQRPGRAIFTYDGITPADPTSTAPTTGVPADCIQPRTTPQIIKNVDRNQFIAKSKTLPVSFGPVAERNGLILWTVNGSSIRVDPGNPTLKMVKQNQPIPREYNVIEVNSNDRTTWTYWIIQNNNTNPGGTTPPIAHPIHLHGHDSYVLGAGVGTFNPTTNINDLKFDNPPRRDVVQLPGGGWLVLAYPTDNPGAWLMHCHIAFHVGMGLSVQFLENKRDISIPAIPASEWASTCQNWNNYAPFAVYKQDDSGL